MCSNIPDVQSKQELNDSGYDQDESGSKPAVEEYKGTAQLLDLSDDVLLYILKNCKAQDLKALGFTCPRLGALILDRTLWCSVDAGGIPHGRRRVRWLLTRALGPHTRRLRLCGYARKAEGCLGFVNRYDMPAPREAAVAEEERSPRVYRLTSTLPRYGGGFPFWPNSSPARPPSPASAPSANGCPGPQLTFTHTGLRELGKVCPNLSTLELEDCVIDCQTTNIGMFPKTLTRLSLKGTKCFNLESKSFLFKIQDHLSRLEELDVSYCAWIEPACMLPLSKMDCLRVLSMRECHKLAEFVAYASLATRYGFKKLKVLDLRGSPVGDSEVSAFGWLTSLEELYLAPSPEHTPVRDHAHYSQDVLPEFKELDDWEEADPEYFKTPGTSEEDWLLDEEGRSHRFCSNSCTEDPRTCILLERMVAEPVAPDECAQVYHQFLTGHNRLMPITSPDEYREAFRHYMAGPIQPQPPADHSAFVRDGSEGVERQRVAKRRRSEPDQQPGTSSESESSPEAKPGTSGLKRKADEPGPSDRRDSHSSDRRDSHSSDRRDSHSSDDDAPPDTPRKFFFSPEHDNAAKKPRRLWLPQRIFEITINDSTAQVSELHPPDVAPIGVIADNEEAMDLANDNNNENNNIMANNNIQDVPGPSNANIEERPAMGIDTGPSGAKRPQANDKEASSSCDDDDTEEKQEGATDNVKIEVGENYITIEMQKPETTGETNDTELCGVKVYNTENASALPSDEVEENNESEAAEKEAGDGKNADGNVESNAGSSQNNDGNVENKAGSSQNYDGNAENKAGSSQNYDGNAENKDGSSQNYDGNAENKAGSSQNYDGNADRKAGSSQNNDGNAENKTGNDKEPLERSLANEAYRVQRLNDNLRSQANLYSIRDRNVNRSREFNEAFARSADDAADRPQRMLQFRRYRRTVVIEEFINNVCIDMERHRQAFPGGMPGAPARLDHASLVSDASIRRFGRAVGENINYLFLGGGPAADGHARPDRSNLRVLSVTGFQHVTDAALTHLASAAPRLRRLDVSGTAVTARARDAFCALRPDVQLVCRAAGPSRRSSSV